MEQPDIFELIHMIEQMNNDSIMQFTKAFHYPIGVSPILVLAELQVKGPQKQAELAETVGYTKGAMTSISEKLVRLGLAERLYDENDRRTIQLKITAAGKQALNEAKAIGQRLFMQLFDVLDENELQQYMQIQQKLLQGLQQRKNQQ